MSEKIKFGVIYGLPEKYATSIRIKNLTERLENVEIIKIQPKEWPDNLFKKVGVVLKNSIKVLNPKFKPDVIYASAPLIASSIPAILAKKLRGIPLIIDWDDAFVDFRLHTPKPWEIPFWEYWSVRLADKVVVVSPELRKAANYLGKNLGDIVYISNGVDVELFDPEKYSKERKAIRSKHSIKPWELVVGFVGRISLRKGKFAGMGIAELAMALNEKGIGGYKFMIVGFGEGLELFKAFVKSHNIDSYFIFTGYIPHEDVPKYISAMDVAVIPVGKKFTDTVRSSCKLKEFMAMGKPVITVNFGSFRYETEYGKFAILVEDNDNLADAVIKLDRKTIKKLSILVRKHSIRKFDLRNLSGKLKTLLLGKS